MANKPKSEAALEPHTSRAAVQEQPDGGAFFANRFFTPTKTIIFDNQALPSQPARVQVFADGLLGLFGGEYQAIEEGALHPDIQALLI